MSAFGYHGNPDNDAFRRERVLADLYYRSSDAFNIYKRLGTLVSSDDGKQYQASYNQYGAYLNALQDSADNCYASITNCKLPPNTVDPIVWPINQVSECERWRLKAYHLGLLNDKSLAMFRELGLAPVYQDPAKGIQAQVICEAMGLGR
jgi:hypothetical protein